VLVSVERTSRDVRQPRRDHAALAFVEVPARRPA
jgi:hypothetical protein